MTAIIFLREWIFSPITMPIWWYTEGFKLFVKKSYQVFTYYRHTLGVSIWVRNIFVPMFGLYDWQSRIISVFMRIAQIIARSIALIIAFIIFIASIAVYIFILPTVIIGSTISLMSLIV